MIRPAVWPVNDEPMRFGSVVVLLVAVLGATACAARLPAFPGSTRVFDPGGVQQLEKGGSVSEAPNLSPGAEAPLQSVAPRLVERPEGAALVEAVHSELRTAVEKLAASRTAANHRAVGYAYNQAGVPDMAFEHFFAATELNRRDAGAYEAMARIWRDWGFPHLGIGDAQRAVFYAPEAPGPVNTLGTLFAAMGRGRDAVQCFERALRMDPRADYAWDNLCEVLRRQDVALASKRGCGNAERLPR